MTNLQYVAFMQLSQLENESLTLVAWVMMSLFPSKLSTTMSPMLLCKLPCMAVVMCGISNGWRVENVAQDKEIKLKHENWRSSQLIHGRRSSPTPSLSNNLPRYCGPCARPRFCRRVNNRTPVMIPLQKS